MGGVLLRAALIAASFGGVAGAFVVAVPQAALADAVDDQVAEFKALVETGDEPRIVARIAALRRKRDPRFDAALLDVARSSTLEAAAREAMRILGLHGDAGYLRWAKSKFGDRKMAEDHAAQYQAMLDSLPAAGEALKPYRSALSKLVSDSMVRDPDTAVRAVRAYASGGADRSVVEQLIDWLAKLESGSGGGGGARGGVVIPPPTMNGGGGGSGASTQSVKDEILASLRKLTDGEGGDADSWKTWWSLHKSSFEPRPARPPEPEWGKLAQYEDDLYGFVLRKPEGDAGWSYGRCPLEGGRVRLEYRKAGDLLARADVLVRRKGSAADAAAFAKGLEAVWRKGEFSDFFPGDEPVAAAVKLGGRDAALLRARGIAAGAWKDWDGCERRTWVAPADGDLFLVIEAVTRTGLDEAVRKALWADVEALRFLED